MTKFPFDIFELQKLISDGYVNVQKHPKYDLLIYNYSHKCQFDQKWNEITKLCRGLILDKDYNIITRPFTKFFNYEELDSNFIPWASSDYVYVQEKIDGSLGILFYYNEWILATRGSFTSDQAIRGWRF